MNGDHRRRGHSPQYHQRNGYSNYDAYNKSSGRPNSTSGPRCESRGLRNRRQSDLSWGNNTYDNRSFSSQDSDYDYRHTEMIREDGVLQFVPNSRFTRQIKHRRHRMARSISVGITSIILFSVCYWGIGTGVGLMRSTMTYFTSYGATHKEIKSDDIKKDESQKRRRQIKEQLAKIEIEDRSLRGVSEKVGAMSNHRHNGKRTSVDEGDSDQMINAEKKSIESTNQLGQNLGKDATNDFFYAGKFSHQEYDETHRGDGAFTAFSYATLPFSDCNPFVISVWIYLSPESERGDVFSISDNEDEPPRVILTTRTQQTGEGCISDLFGSSTSDPATGMILYAQPHFGDEDVSSKNGQTPYKIMLDYAVAKEKRCRTLVGAKTELIREGEWHHVVIFASRIDHMTTNAKQGAERVSIYIDGDLASADESVSNRLCSDSYESTTVAGRYELLNFNNDAYNEKSRFDLDGRLGMLAYWEIGGAEVITKQSQRMHVHTTRDEEHVVRGINRARFDIGAIRDLSQQGLSVKEPSLLYTFDEQEDIHNHIKLMLSSDVKEMMTGLHHGKTQILSPYTKTTVELTLDEEPFVPLGGNRYLEYRDGTFVPPQRSTLELRQLNEIARARSLRVKEAMIHLWSGYKKFAWGKDELLPLSNSGQDNWGSMGTTLVDSLSTLWMLGMTDEFWEARDWVKQSLNFNNVKKAVSVFETTIRNLGSMLSAYDLSGDEVFLEKADDLGTRLLKAFNSPSGVPHGEVELFDGGKSFNTGWHAASAALAEIGTLQIEFRYLAQATGKTEYATTSMRALDALLKLQTESGLYPTLIHNLKSSLSFANNDISIGAMGDSFYEYLLKIWLQGGKKEIFYRTMYDKAVEGIMHKLICRRNGLTYVAELKNGKLDHKMDHLSCFLGGNLALGAYTHPEGLESQQAQRQLITGKQLAYTCYQMYARGKYGLPSEYVKFGGNAKDDFTPATDAPFYILRPETAETFFILYHLTKDSVYQEWGWEVFRAIDASCRTEAGFAALRNVQTAQQNNRMESFFPAETLKYLYLLQDNSHQIDLLNTHVFNTEAHPLRLLDKI